MILKTELGFSFSCLKAFVPEPWLGALLEAVTPGSGKPLDETWRPDQTPASLETLGEWFAGQVETRSRSEDEIQRIKSRLVFPMDIPGMELTSRTFSVAMDVGMYFSQVLLKNYPSLKWEQPFGNKKFADYGQPLLKGFGPVSLNPIRIAVTLAYGLASNNKTSRRLHEIYIYWAQRVQLTP